VSGPWIDLTQGSPEPKEDSLQRVEGVPSVHSDLCGNRRAPSCGARVLSRRVFQAGEVALALVVDADNDEDTHHLIGCS
jgi:hypothetical protein